MFKKLRLQEAEALGWVPCSERLPGDCEEYLVVIKGLVYPDRYVGFSKLNPAKTGFYVKYDEDGNEPTEQVTHWQPRPALPALPPLACLGDCATCEQRGV